MNSVLPWTSEKLCNNSCRRHRYCSTVITNTVRLVLGPYIDYTGKIDLISIVLKWQFQTLKLSQKRLKIAYCQHNFYTERCQTGLRSFWFRRRGHVGGFPLLPRDLTPPTFKIEIHTHNAPIYTYMCV
jgi:hypothetical protein